MKFYLQYTGEEEHEVTHDEYIGTMNFQGFGTEPDNFENSLVKGRAAKIGPVEGISHKEKFTRPTGEVRMSPTIHSKKTNLPNSEDNMKDVVSAVIAVEIAEGLLGNSDSNSDSSSDNSSTPDPDPFSGSGGDFGGGGSSDSF